MEDYTQDSQTQDASPDIITQKVWDETIISVDTPGKYGSPNQSTNFISGSRGWRLNSNGVAEFSGLIIRDVLYTVPVGGDIQAAINVLNNSGGGTVQLQAGTYTLTSSIFLSDGIKIVGAGIDATILDFSGGSVGIQCAGDVGDILSNWSIQNLTVQNSANQYAINIDYSDFWLIENVKVYSCDNDGIRITRSQYYTLNSVTVNACTGIGFIITTGPTRFNYAGTFNSCYAISNGSTGFFIDDYNTSALTQGFVFSGCVSDGNTQSGFFITSNVTTTYSYSLGSFIGCRAINNGGRGIDIEQYVSLLSFVGVFSGGNTGDNIEIGGLSITFIGGGCSSLGSTKNVDILSTAQNIIFQGFLSPTNSANAPSTYFATSADKDIEISGVNSQSPRISQKMYKMLNNTGSTINAGECVVFSGAGATGERIATTTTLGDDLVFGMAIAAITTGNYGDILIEGYTELLKVNGTTDIAAGDFLCTYTTAGIACKATAGDMAFAIALEAYTGNDSNGIVNALLIGARKL